MDDSETLEDRLRRHEGFRATAYRDTRGNVTIGIGRCLTTAGISDAEAAWLRRDFPNRPMEPESLVLTYLEARHLLANDIARCRAAVGDLVRWPATLSDVRRDVLVEMAFQLGTAGLARFHDMLAALRAGDFSAAADAIRSSHWARETPARAEELARIMQNGG